MTKEEFFQKMAFLIEEFETPQCILGVYIDFPEDTSLWEWNGERFSYTPDLKTCRKHNEAGQTQS